MERLLAVSSRRSTHASFHVGQTRTTRAGSDMAAGGTDRQVFGANRTNIIELGRVLPDVDELLSPHVAAGKGKLHAGENISVGRDVSQGVTSAARISFHHIFVRRRRGSAKFFDVPYQALIVKDAVQLRAWNTQTQNGSVTIHLRRDGRVQSVGNAQLAGQRLHPGAVSHIGCHQHIGNYNPQSLLS